MSNAWYVISGAPGSGKTTLVNHFASLGYAIIPESARAVIDASLAAGIPLEEIRADELKFQREVLQLQMHAEAHAAPDQPTFLDRGIPDAAAYYSFKGFPRDEMLSKALASCVYKKIFLLEPLSMIPDYARTESKEEQMRIYETIIETYKSLPFPIQFVPALPLEERATYILNRLDA